MRAQFVLVVGLIAAVAFMQFQLKRARADLQTVQAVAAGYQAADQFRLKQQAAAQEAAAVDLELSQGVGADAPLSDYLRRGAGRVWP
jgi:hypothetical protein